MKKHSTIIDSEDMLKALAFDLAKNVAQGDVITLIGDLGAGKTTFAKYFVEYFSSDIEVTSPTYPILNIYEFNRKNIFHYDLYRIKREDELAEINFVENIEKGISLVEWPEIAYSYLPQKFIIVKIKNTYNNNRLVEIGQYEK